MKGSVAHHDYLRRGEQGAVATSEDRVVKREPWRQRLAAATKSAPDTKGTKGRETEHLQDDRLRATRRRLRLPLQELCAVASVCAFAWAVLDFRYPTPGPAPSVGFDAFKPPTKQYDSASTVQYFSRDGVIMIVHSCVARQCNTYQNTNESRTRTSLFSNKMNVCLFTEQ